MLIILAPPEKAKLAELGTLNLLSENFICLVLPGLGLSVNLGPDFTEARVVRGREMVMGDGEGAQQVVRLLCLACYARKLIHIYLTVHRVELLPECGRAEGRTVQSRVHLSFDCFNLNLNLITVKFRYLRLTRGYVFGLGLD